MYLSFTSDSHAPAQDNSAHDEPAQPEPSQPCTETFDSSTLPSDIPGALALARDLGQKLATPGDGTTAAQWERLAVLAAHDLGVARAIEPHLDAVAILVQAGWRHVEGTWGVFAAEGGDDPLTAKQVGDSWVLNGTKPWCSLASALDSALVTARVDGDESRLFAVNLTQAGITTDDSVWVSRGLSEIPSGPVQFRNSAAQPVGEAGWYLVREGFAWGGIGVAACWFGGAVGIARLVLHTTRRAPSAHRYAHLGAIDTLLHACQSVLTDAAAHVDRHTPDGKLLAKRVRGLVARTCEEVIYRAGHALGPAPLATDPEHSKRIADLQIYVRQHHAERDDASLGELLTLSDGIQW